jgi:hypothetical protein
VALLGRQRQLLDGQEQPDRERQADQGAAEAHRQPGAVALGQLGAVGADVERPAVEVDVGQRADPEDHQDGKAASVTMTVTRNESSTPAMLSQRNTA